MEIMGTIVQDETCTNSNNHRAKTLDVDRDLGAFD